MHQVYESTHKDRRTRLRVCSAWLLGRSLVISVCKHGFKGIKWSGIVGIMIAVMNETFLLCISETCFGSGSSSGMKRAVVCKPFACTWMHLCSLIHWSRRHLTNVHICVTNQLQAHTYHWNSPCTCRNNKGWRGVFIKPADIPLSCDSIGL